MLNVITPGVVSNMKGAPIAALLEELQAPTNSLAVVSVAAAEPVETTAALAASATVSVAIAELVEMIVETVRFATKLRSPIVSLPLVASPARIMENFEITVSAAVMLLSEIL